MRKRRKRIKMKEKYNNFISIDAVRRRTPFTFRIFLGISNSFLAFWASCVGTAEAERENGIYMGAPTINRSSSQINRSLQVVSAKKISIDFLTPVTGGFAILSILFTINFTYDPPDGRFRGVPNYPVDRWKSSRIYAYIKSSSLVFCSKVVSGGSKM